MQSQQVVVKPLDCLEECLLLGELDHPVVDITADGKSVLNTRVEIDLVGLAGLLEDPLGLVTILSREDSVSLGRGDRERARNACQLLLFYE